MDEFFPAQKKRKEDTGLEDETNLIRWADVVTAW